MAKKIRVGTTVTIPAGTRVTSQGVTNKRSVDTQVTVRSVEYTRAGNPKVYWKSNGYSASAVLA